MIETFGGLCDTPDGNDVPPFMARRAENCAWKPGSVEKRPGFASWASVSPLYPRGLYSWPARPSSSNPTGRELVMVGSDGELRARKPDASALWAGSGMDNLSNVTVVPTAVRTYDSLVLAFSDGSRPATFAEQLLYPDAATPSPSGWRTFVESPPRGLSLTQVVGGGSCTAGAHTFWGTFEMVDGAMSPPTPPTTLTVNSNDRISITFSDINGSVPYGLNVKNIWLWGSPAGDTQNGYVFAKIDPASLPYVFALSDAILTTNVKADFNYLKRIAAPFMPAAVAPQTYKGRTCFIGSPHRFYPGAGSGSRSLNTTFIYTGSAKPGWSTLVAGGVLLTERYRISFDGASSSRGMLVNDGFIVEDLAGKCSRGAGIFSLARWGIRVLARRSAGLTNANLRFGAKPASASPSWYLDVAAASIGTKWTLLEASATGASWGDDIRLYLEGRGPGVNGEYVEIALCEVYDPGSRWEQETVWWSQPSLPREVDMTYGPATIATGSGQKVRSGFQLGDRWYYVLEKSLWVTQDNGGEPSQWPIEKVCDGVGTPSFNGVGIGKEWAIIAGPEGCWFFDGGGVGEDNDLSREIKSLWARIPWALYGDLVTVEVMKSRKQVWIGVPLDSATEVSHMLVLDYTEGFSSGMGGGGVGRRWSLWTVAPGGKPVEFEDANGTTRAMVGLGTRVLYLDETSHDDNGGGVAWAWESGPIGRPEGGLALYRRLLLSAEGNGYLSPTLVKGSGETISLLSPTLYSPRRGDSTILFSVTDERVAVRVSQPATLGVWARLTRMALAWARRPFADVRRQNP